MTTINIKDIEAEAKRRGVPVYVILDEIAKNSTNQLN